MKDDSRRDRIYVVIGILFLVNIVAIVLAAAALAGKNHSKAEVTALPAVSTTPLVVPPGWERSGNLFYKCFTDGNVNYATAKANCAAAFDGARLAAKVLRDPAAVRYILDNYSGLNMWVGFDDIQNEGTWVWSDGGDMNPETTRWKPNEPNNYNDANEDCGHLEASSKEKLLLNDDQCGTSHKYICEIDSN